jgi:hypothetical protein
VPRRDEIAECSEKSYASLPVSAGQKLLNFRSQDDFVAYAKQVPTSTTPTFGTDQALLRVFDPLRSIPCTHPGSFVLSCLVQRGWEVKDGRVDVQKKEEDNKAQVPSLQIIAQTLQYVKELERIV